MHWSLYSLQFSVYVTTPSAWQDSAVPLTSSPLHALLRESGSDEISIDATPLYRACRTACRASGRSHCSEPAPALTSPGPHPVLFSSARYRSDDEGCGSYSYCQFPTRNL
eukprot:417215_1